MAADVSSVLVLTLGAGGSIAFHGERVVRQPALPVHRVVDTTGCGDAFQAAFTARFACGGSLSECLQAGALAGQQATRHYGAQKY